MCLFGVFSECIGVTELKVKYSLHTHHTHTQHAQNIFTEHVHLSLSPLEGGERGGARLITVTDLKDFPTKNTTYKNKQSISTKQREKHHVFQESLLLIYSRLVGHIYLWTLGCKKKRARGFSIGARPGKDDAARRRGALMECSHARRAYFLTTHKF